MNHIHCAFIILTLSLNVLSVTVSNVHEINNAADNVKELQSGKYQPENCVRISKQDTVIQFTCIPPLYFCCGTPENRHCCYQDDISQSEAIVPNEHIWWTDPIWYLFPLLICLLVVAFYGNSSRTFSVIHPNV